MSKLGDSMDCYLQNQRFCFGKKSPREKEMAIQSRSIGPTMSRFGIPARRSQSGESRCRIDGCSRSEAASTSSTSKGCDDRGRELHLMGKNAQEKIQKGGEERQDH